MRVSHVYTALDGRDGVPAHSASNGAIFVSVYDGNLMAAIKPCGVWASVLAASEYWPRASQFRFCFFILVVLPILRQPRVTVPLCLWIGDSLRLMTENAKTFVTSSNKKKSWYNLWPSGELQQLPSAVWFQSAGQFDRGSSDTDRNRINYVINLLRVVWSLWTCLLSSPARPSSVCSVWLPL